MKSRLTGSIITAFAFASSVQLHAQGFIVPNGFTYGGIDELFGSRILVLQNPANSDHAGFFLKSQGANMFSFSTLLDEGVRVFLVNLNQPISLAAISSQSYAELLHPNSYFLSSIAPTYVGLYTGYSPWSSDGTYTGIYRDPLFGWARLVNNQGVIQLTTSALAYGAGGIFAGTQNIIQVPEPGALILTALGAVLIGLCSRKNSGRG